VPKPIPHRPFRFGLQGRSLGPRDEWLAMIRRAEDLGFSTYLALDHFVRGLDPVASLMAAALATTTMRVGGFVFDNDFRHPALLAKAAATIDVLSDGRFELGIGAGWLKEEYDQTGIPFDPATVRIARMEEAIRLLKLIFREDPTVSFAGEHYTVTNLICTPRPVQRPHPPFLIGGGSKRVLSIAGREADVVGITTRARHDGLKETTDLTAAATEQKIAWIREAAGARFARIELNMVVGDVIVTSDRRSAAEDLAGQYGVTPDEILASPLVLIGTPDEMIEQLLAHRERFGFTYVVVTEPNMDKLAPIVGRLAGT
jgi:probable F420-dependent oxidoreductase